VNCELLRNSQSELTAILGLGSGRKRNGQRERKVTERLSLVRMQPLAWKKKQFLCNHKPCPHCRTKVRLSQKSETVTEFGDSLTFVRQYSRTFLRLYCDLYLEHTLDSRSPGYHRVQVWSQSGHLCRSRSDLRKKVYRRTDRRTDRRRTPRHCISSWNELKIT